ncbi:enoyl-CoA hydratase/isomerase family protein [Thalassotalea agarivorans]|uniref:3-hydroxyisobutyryl-CoA hydrolase n=1 Tax=Thalassotalea agarivorans TaxID=349064 RepID=A0A1I0I180_THASX|nr:enoyl-CoA hydratase/isomerase family protein [Thalassotalea agarivorans]SET89477.1 Enoyl-CoA hydratase/carnithine racemase [Thalassotalea agarivorans]
MSESVLFEELMTNNGKKIAVATLNAPKALNALNLDMIRLLSPAFEQWQSDDSIALVVLQGSGDRAFCAGGDVVSLYKAMVSPEQTPDFNPASYFAEEYQLDFNIHQFAKPVLVWGSGIVMGGGLGLLAGASHRVVTNTSRIAMPEVTIGLFPDVGGSYFLNKMPGKSGLFLGLTGASVNSSDAIYTKLANYFMLDEQKEALFDALINNNWQTTATENHVLLSTVLDSFYAEAKSEMPAAQVEAHQVYIDDVCQGDDVVSVYEKIVSLDIDSKWFNKAQAGLKHGSKLSAAIVFNQLANGKDMSLADCFKMELNLGARSAEFGEFQEGVRALLIDKDNQPNWAFKQITDVDVKTIEWFFEDAWQSSVHPLASLGGE